MNNDPILGFTGEYRWLSNFWRLEYPIEVNGYNFYTTENLYQAFKCAKIEDFPYFVDITPGEAKKLGRTIEIIDGWDSMKLDVMKELQIIKYTQPKFRDLLIQTGDRYHYNKYQSVNNSSLTCLSIIWRDILYKIDADFILCISPLIIYHLLVMEINSPDKYLGSSIDN